MNIQEALLPTGKAKRDIWLDGEYIYLNHDGLFMLVGSSGHKTAYNFKCILDAEWQSCPIEKEIRPEKAGELWQKSCDYFMYMIATERINKLVAIPSMTDLLTFDIEKHGRDMIHGKNGWKRLFPKVEDSNVERVIFENVTFQEKGSHECQD
jgi:hypothetical protein